MDVPTSAAALEGALDTAGFGFRDEIYGLSEASGLPGWLGGLRAPIGGARLALEKWRAANGENQGGITGLVTGDSRGPVEKSYEQARDVARGVQKAAREQQPGYFLGGQLAGGFISPGLAAAKGATVGARAARAASAGAIQGGLYGVGSGETAEDRALGGVTGAALGGTVGAAASPLMDAAGIGLQKAGGFIKSAYDALRAEINPTVGKQIVNDEASKRIVLAQVKDIENRGPAWAPEEATAASQAGIPRTIADTGGENMMALARSAANQSPSARETLTNLAQERFAGQSRRAADLIRTMTGGRDAGAILEDLQAQARATNRPAYAKAYSDGSNGIWSPELERLAGSPAVRQAAIEASNSGQNRAIADGFGAFNPGLQVTDDGRLIINGRGGVPTYPDMQFWDYTYRNLRDAGDAAFRGGRGSEGSALKTLSKQLRDELDSQVPSYQTARQGASAAFGAEDALEAGQKFVTAKGQNGDYARAMTKFNPAEKELFARGFASELSDRILELRDNQDVIKQAFLTSPASKQRINMALGSDRATQLEAYLRAEGLADRLRTSLGNSTTVRQFAEMGLAGAGTLTLGHGALEGEWDTKHLLTAGLLLGAAGFRHSTQKLDSSIASRIGEMLASSDPAVLHRGVQIVAKSQKLMGALRTAGDRIGFTAAANVAPKTAMQPIVSNRGGE